jgi:uncharacterized protein (DUF433 family)/DNA-binding transcriptional MerR regulator
LNLQQNGKYGSLASPIYEPAEVARLVGLTASRVRRWLFGYHFRVGADRRERKQVPVIRRQNGGRNRYASFLDLIELLSVKSFLDHGLSLQRVRRACDEAASVLGVDHPFARRRFFTSGREIYLELQNRSQASNLLQLLSGGQWVIEPIINEFAEQIDFDMDSDLAAKWWPLGKDKLVVLDPLVSFGAPSIVGRGVKTANVFDLYRAERQKAEVVARWMNLTLAEVEAAVRFEKKQVRQAA